MIIFKNTLLYEPQKDKEKKTHKKKIEPTTDTKVALDLSEISLEGESPFERFRFFLGLKIFFIYERSNKAINDP